MAWAVAVTLFAMPSPASAQRDAFIEAVIGFHASVIGLYGDEGPRVMPRLEEMRTSLAEWNRQIRAAEDDIRARATRGDREAVLQGRLLLAEHYAGQGRYAEAVRELDAVERAGVEIAGMHVLRAVILEATERSSEALERFRRAWELSPEDPVHAYLLASRWLESGAPVDDVRAALAVLMAAHLEERLVPPTPLPFLELALVPDRAAVTPVFSPARYAEGFRLMARHDYEAAMAQFTTAAARDPLVTDPAVRAASVQAGIALFKDGESELAIPHLEAAVATLAGSSEASRLLAAAYTEAGVEEQSIAHFETAVQLAPFDERARVAFGKALIHFGRFDAAEQVLLETVAALPESAEGRSALADLYERVDRGLDALRQIETVAGLTVPAGKASLYWRLARLHHRYLQYDLVVAPLRLRARLTPNDPAAHRDLGLALTQIGQPDGALVEYVMASLLDPQDGEALVGVGQILFDTGQHTDAVRTLSRAIALMPDSAQARLALGSALHRLGRTHEAEEHLGVFRRLHTAARVGQARRFEQDRFRADAMRLEQEGQHERAVQAWQEVVARGGQDASHRMALARALARVGDREAAIAVLREAATVDAEPEVYRLLSELYAGLGRSDESAAAHAMYQQRQRDVRTRLSGGR